MSDGMNIRGCCIVGLFCFQLFTRGKMYTTLVFTSYIEDPKMNSLYSTAGRFSSIRNSDSRRIRILQHSSGARCISCGMFSPSQAMFTPSSQPIAQTNSMHRTQLTGFFAAFLPARCYDVDRKLGERCLNLAATVKAARAHCMRGGRSPARAFAHDHPLMTCISAARSHEADERGNTTVRL